jgi:TRAP-type C4-dicarboxylate transport system permease small subunit
MTPDDDARDVPSKPETVGPSRGRAIAQLAVGLLFVVSGAFQVNRVSSEPSSTLDVIAALMVLVGGIGFAILAIREIRRARRAD